MTDKIKHEWSDEMNAKDMNEESFAFEESVNDMVSEVMEKEGKTLPPMSELVEEASAIEKALSRTKKDPERKTPLVESKAKKAPTISAKTKQPQKKGPTKAMKPVFSAPEPKKNKGEIASTDTVQSPQADSDPLDEKYQESFASQVETAEMRNEIETMSLRLKNMESLVEGLVKERESLPLHVDRLKSTINSQFTVMTERLNAAIESGTIGSALAQTSVDATNMSRNATETLDVFDSNLRQPPSASSDIASPKVIVSGKKKVRVIR